MILQRLVVGPYASNCYIVGDEATKEAIIIDPGAEADRILATVAELELKVTLIVITHKHSDHIGALKPVREATGIPAAIHVDDADGNTEQPGKLQLLRGDETIQVGNLSFKVIFTPGHSRGGICLYGHGVLFSGDTLFNFGIGRYDLPGGNYRQLMNGIHTKLMVLPDETNVYPGHGPETTIGAERRGNPFINEQF